MQEGGRHQQILGAFELGGLHVNQFRRSGKA